MKKIVIIVGILVVAVGAGAAILFLKPGAKQAASLEAVLPAGPVAVLRATDLDQNLTALAQTQFWQKLSAIDVKQAMKSSGAKDQELANFDRISQQMTSPNTQMVLKKFFGKEVIAAFYSVDVDQFSPEALNKVVSNLFFVTRLSPEVKFIDLFSQFLGKSSSDFKVESFPYQKHTVYNMTSNDGTIKIGYVQIGDLLVFGATDNAAKACLDVLSGLKRSLKEDPAYNQTKARYTSGSTLTGFLNFEEVYMGLKGQALKLASAQDGGPKTFQKQMENNFKQMQGFKTIGLSVVFAPVSKAKFDVTFVKAEIADEFKSVYNCAPKANGTLAFTPQDALGYQWTACQDFHLYWSQYQKEMETAAKAVNQTRDVKDLVAEMEKNLKFSVEGDLLPALGDEMGGYVTDVDLTGAFPVPKLVFFVKIADQGKAVKVVDALLAQQPVVRPEEADYEGTKIKYLTIPMLTNIQPGYAFVGDYLLVSSNWDLLKKAVDAKSGKSAALLSNPTVGQLGTDLNAPSNSALFVQTDTVMEKAEAMVDWSIKWAALQAAKQEAFKKGSQQRLLDIKTEIKQHETQLETLRNEQKSLGDVAVAPAEPPAPTPADPNAAPAAPPTPDTSANAVADRAVRLKQQIADEENALLTAQDTQKQLEQMVKELEDAGTVDIKSRQVLADQVAKPLIRAFASLKGFISRMTFGDGIIQNNAAWRLE